MKLRLPIAFFRTTVTDWLASAMVETVIKAADSLPASNDYCDNCSCESCIFVRSYRRTRGELEANVSSLQKKNGG